MAPSTSTLSGARMSFGTWAERWQETLVSLRPSSADRDRRYLRNHVMPTFGRYELGRINHPMVAAWVAELAQRRAPATVHKAHQIMAKIMRSAVDAGLLANSPCDRVPLPKVEHTEMRFLAPDEIGDLADAIGDEWRSLVLVGCYGGLRIGELHGLRVPRVDLLRAQVDVAEIVTDVAGHLYTGPPKTRAGRRTVQLPRFVVDELAEHLGGRSDGLVWPNENGDHLRVTSWRRRSMGARRGSRRACTASMSRHAPHRGRPVDRRWCQPHRDRPSGRAPQRRHRARPLRTSTPGRREPGH